MNPKERNGALGSETTMIGFIVNPVSGNGKGRKVWDRLEPALKGLGAHYRVRKTSEQGEAQKLAKELIQKEGVKKIIAVGGDGTVHEVINGIQESGQACIFGLVPAGSGNDYARGHGLSEDPLRALQQILSDQDSRWIDLLRINERIAVNSVGVGFDAWVAKTTNESAYKRWLNKCGLGGIAYVLSVIRLLFSYQPGDVTLTVDGQVIHIANAWFIAIANIPNYGGGMLICPGALPDSGEAKVCVVHNISRLGLLLAFPKIFSGAHGDHPGVQFFTGRHIHVDADRPLFVHADGEVIGVTPAHVEILPVKQAIFG